MHRDSCPLDCKVYVGNLGNNGNKTELERAFGYYGPLRSVWVARNPPGFAFVEFEDPRDAADAVRELDGRTLCGCRVRVELSNGEKRSRNRGPPPSWGRRPRDDYRRRSPPPRRRSPRRRSFSRSRSRYVSVTIAWTALSRGLKRNSLILGQTPGWALRFGTREKGGCFCHIACLELIYLHSY
ncbi:serine/arginine-rich splicing factor 3 isoform X1 [Phalacrocorax carbo]|uniref:serine/arginine-rich splicing factor 3 isoform X1 n=1 Tax=Phalacrocorax carbo TaxID=9209 RepID=UPI003119E8D2